MTTDMISSSTGFASKVGDMHLKSKTYIFVRAFMTNMLIHLIKCIFGWGASTLVKLGRYITIFPPEKLHIKCVNPDCTAPDHIFEFDERNLGTHGAGSREDHDSREFIVKCPFCGTMNSIWLKIDKHSASYRVGATIVRDTPLE